jgi:hypothetical protein
LELNLYEHKQGDLLELSAYNLDAKTNLGHVYLKKSALLPVIESVMAERMEVEKEEAKSLGIKHYPQDAAQLAAILDKSMGEYITARTNLDFAEGSEGVLCISVTPLNSELHCNVHAVLTHMHLHICTDLCMYGHILTHVLIYMYFYLSIHPSIHLSIYLSIYTPIYLSVYLSIYLSICLFI